MAHVQRLKLTLRHVPSDRTWTGQPVTAVADPEENDTLLKHLESMARNLDHRTGEPWWLDQYMLRYQGLDETWRDEWISGAGN